MSALDGVRVLDLSRLAPGPYASMLLADHGADVIVVDPIADAAMDERQAAFFTLGRNKRSICLDLKNESALSVFHRLAETADVVLEGFRPGVTQRLRIDYETLRAKNPRLVYCSLSGYGQSGPYAQMAGHDLNYAAIAGALGMIGRPNTPPAIPMNFVADYAGGSLMAAFAIVTALFARTRTGEGQYIDVAMTDGALSLCTKLVGQYFESQTIPTPGAHRINGGAPYYDVYECADGRYLAVGALEPRFFRNFCNTIEKPELAALQNDRTRWSDLRAAIGSRLKERARDDWFALLKDADACVTPVYALDEALADPHNRAREMIATHAHRSVGSLTEVGLVPKLTGTPPSRRRPPPRPGEHAREILAEAGYPEPEIAALLASGAVAAG